MLCELLKKAGVAFALLLEAYVSRVGGEHHVLRS